MYIFSLKTMYCRQRQGHCQTNPIIGRPETVPQLLTNLLLVSFRMTRGVAPQHRCIRIKGCKDVSYTVPCPSRKLCTTSIGVNDSSLLVYISEHRISYDLNYGGPENRDSFNLLLFMINNKINSVFNRKRLEAKTKNQKKQNESF